MVKAREHEQEPSSRPGGPGASIPAGDPVWRSAPTVVLRFRSLFAALAIGALLVSVVATAYPLFLSASENELLASAIGKATVTPYGMGVAYRGTSIGFDQGVPGDGSGLLRERREQVFAREAARSDVLGPTESAIFGGVVSVTDTSGRPPPTGPVEGRLFAGTDALDHVRVLSGTEGPGVWLPDFAATPLGIGPGDEVELHSETGRTRVAVDGVYAALYTQPRQGYWRLWNDQIYPCPDVTCFAPPQFILAELDQIVDLSASLGLHSATFAWQAPVMTDPALTLTQAQELARFSEDLEDRMSPRGDLHRLFWCCGRIYSRGARGSEVTFSSNADLVVNEVRQRNAAVQGPMLVLLVAGLAIALAVVGAAGVFAAVGRRVEMGVLTIRGWSPVAFGAKAALETVLPAVIGGVAGFAAATMLVAWIGPSAPVTPAATVTAMTAAIAGTVVSVATIGVVSAFAFVSRHELRHRLTGALAMLPWELLAFAAAWVLAGRLDEGGVIESGGVERPQPAVYLFPLALALGAGIVCARLARFALRLTVRSRASGASAPWLAVRRLRSAPALTSLFLVSGILTLTVSTSALATVASLRTTVDAKAQVFVGSEVQVQVSRDAEVAGNYEHPVTKVDRFRDAGSIDDSDAPFDLLVIDPATFAGAAYWNDAFSDDPLPQLLERLGTGGGTSWPVVVANGHGLIPRSITVAQKRLPVSVVGTATTFPGSSSDTRPLIVIDREMLAAAFAGLADPVTTAPRASTELWIDGPPSDVQGSLDRLGVRPLLVITAEDVRDVPFIDAAVQTFLVLQVLGSAAVALLVVVAVVYLTARQRGRAVATMLSDRMGMRPSTMRAASIVELSALLLVSFLVGAVVGVVATLVVVPSLDPLPTIPPEPLVALPLAALVFTAVVLAVASFVGGAAADRGARRSSGSEVMRVAE